MNTTKSKKNTFLTWWSSSSYMDWGNNINNSEWFKTNTDFVEFSCSIQLFVAHVGYKAWQNRRRIKWVQEFPWKMSKSEITVWCVSINCCEVNKLSEGFGWIWMKPKATVRDTYSMILVLVSFILPPGALIVDHYTVCVDSEESFAFFVILPKYVFPNNSVWKQKQLTRWVWVY